MLILAISRILSDFKYILYLSINFASERKRVMNKKVPLGVTIALMIITASVAITISQIFSINYYNMGYSNAQEMKKAYSKLSEIDDIVSDNYINEADTEQLADGMAAGYVAALGDKWSAYLSKDEYKETLQSMKGKGIGIGINVYKDVDSGYIYISYVMENTPAQTSGLMRGDLIVKVDGADVNEMGYSAAIERLQGEESTVAKITVQRGTEQLNFEIVRKEYTAVSVQSKMLGNIGYIKITDFADNTPEQFASAIETLTKQGAKGLIFDLRNNGGGTLTSVEQMLDKILPEGVIVSAEYKNGEKTDLFTSDAECVDLPMAVITNGNTASAAELFSAAVRDMNKGALIGEKTYGKGVMQQTYNLSDGSALRLTIAKFYPPSGVNFDGVGLTPDIAVSLTEEESKYFYKLEPETDSQVKAALDYFTGKGVS